MYNRCTLVEFRGVWIASVYNIDWPKTLDNPEAQKQEFIEILDKLDSLNINAIFVQVRPTSDALYKSYEDFKGSVVQPTIENIQQRNLPNDIKRSFVHFNEKLHETPHLPSPVFSCFTGGDILPPEFN